VTGQPLDNVRVVLTLLCHHQPALQDALKHPVVVPSELIQVTDFLTLFAGVVSTTPAALQKWPTLLTTPSSATGIVVSRVAVVLLRLQL